MKKILSIPLDDEEIIELYQILIDKDPDSALTFLQTHARSKVHDLLEDG